MDVVGDRTGVDRGAVQRPVAREEHPAADRHHQRGGDQHAEGQQERGLTVHGRASPYRNGPGAGPERHVAPTGPGA